MCFSLPPACDFFPLQIYVIAGVYRLWKCTGGDLDDLGIASVHDEYHGGRDFWFERKHLSSRVCEFGVADGTTGSALNLTFGAVPYHADVRTACVWYCTLLKQAQTV